MRTVGIILAGGLSRRFGSPKAFARIGNEYFYERAIDAVEPHCEEVVVVSRTELLGRYPADVKVITDVPEVAGFGPLAGILSGMEFVEADRYIVLPCDMPYIDEKVIGKLVEFHKEDVTGVIAGGRVHPLVSVWDYKVKDALRNALHNGQFKVMDLLERQRVNWIEGSLLTENKKGIFKNVNTPTDLERS